MKTKIGIRYRVILFALIMSFNTSLIVSGTVIYLHTQSFAQFIKVWLSSFVVAWPIVFTAILVFVPQVNNFLNLFVEEH